MHMLGDMTVARSKRSAAPAVIVRFLDNPAILLIARICVTLPFIVSGLSKLYDWHAGESEMLRSGLHPAWVFALAVTATQLAGSILIVANRGLWIGAGVLGVFTVLTTFIAHRFWELSGDARTTQLNSFLEHWTMSAAFVLVAVVYLRDRRSRTAQGSH